MTTRQDDAERGIESIGPAALEVRTVPPGPAALTSDREVQITRPLRASVRPVSEGLLAAALSETDAQPDASAVAVGRSWDAAVALCAALSERAGLAPAYTLSDWRLRRAYHLDEIGRMLYDRMPFERIASVLARFAEDTLTILQFEPERLAEVDGIGPKTAARVGREWDRTLAWTREVTWDRAAAGWRLPTEAELARLLAVLGPQASDLAAWTWDGDTGPRWSDVPSPLPSELDADRAIDTGNRRIVRGADGVRRALEPTARPEDVGFYLVRNA